ncbi:BQ2448_2676 [Microbotryum intermedium]|uniref:BQ2448_2676 protein n=1 Tax=Microbotryum intermedium TaxID=269621 RepID=A0A238FIS8_9BASI|nr:BQ2448_2676 [Microbotryum intermedium]
MSSDHAQLNPAEVDALPTPHAPGFWPETPAADAYLQNEGPLEQAGRAMQPIHSIDHTIPAEHDILAPAILATGAGLLLGGPVAGIVAGLAAGVAGLEKQGLKKGLAHTDTPNGQFGATQSQDVTPKGSPSASHSATLVPAEPSPSGSTSTHVPEDLTEQKTQAALAASPAQQMLGGEETHKELSALVSGAAGTAVVDMELEEPTTDLKEQTRDPAISNVVPDPAWKNNLMSTGVQTEDAASVTRTKGEGLSSAEKAALGVGAGLGVAGLAAAAHEHERHDASNDSVRPERATTSQPLALNEETPAPVAAAPSSEATVQDADETKAVNSEEDKGWTDGEKLAAGAGAVGVGGLAATALAHEAREHEKMPIQPVQPVQEPATLPPSSGKPSSSSAHPVQPSSSPAALVAANPSAFQASTREVQGDAVSTEEPKEDLCDEEKAVLGVGATRVAAGGLAAAAADDHEQGPPPSSGLLPLAPVDDSASNGVNGPAMGFPAQRDGDAAVSSAPLPAADPANPPVGSYVIPKVIDEERDAATPGKITILSGEERTAELKAGTTQNDETKEEEEEKKGSHNKEVAAAGAALGGVGAVGVYEVLKPEQASYRQITSRFSDTTLGSNMKIAHSGEDGHGTFEDQRYITQDSSLAQDLSHDRVDPATLVTPAAATVPGFAGESSAREDFAHLSEQPEEVASQEDRQGWTTGEKLGAGGVGLGAAALAHYNARVGQQDPPILATNNSLQRVLNESSLPGAEASSKPSSTRAMKGTPVGTPGVEERAMTPDSAYARPTGAADAGAAVPAGVVAAEQYRQQREYYSESPRGESTVGSSPIGDRRSAEAQRLQFQEQYPDVHPVEKSPHMKIATHVDGTGRKKLHRKSLGDVLAPGEGTHFPVQTSTRNASPWVQDNEQGIGSYLSKNRRPSRGAGDDSPDGTASPKKSGFLSKMFGK